MQDDAGQTGAGGDAGHQNATGDGDTGHTTGGDGDAGRVDSGAGRTFSQDEVERIVQARLKKFSDYDELKSRATELENANKSELQKAQDRAADLERRYSELEQQHQERVVEGSIRDAATEQGLNPRLALRLVDMSQIDFSDDGQPTSSSLKKALDTAVREFPELSRGRGTADGGARQSSGRVDMNDLIRSGRRR